MCLIEVCIMLTTQKALWFPNIAGKTLDGEKTNTTDMFKGKVSLVSIMSTRLSEVSSARGACVHELMIRNMQKHSPGPR